MNIDGFIAETIYRMKKNKPLIVAFDGVDTSIRRGKPLWRTMLPKS
jgi:hypothetical protein